MPCLSRASDIEKYDPKSEFALAGDEEGWVATHQDPKGDTAAAAACEADILDLDDAEPSASHQGVRADDDEVPDISELELVEPDDEVGARTWSDSSLCGCGQQHPLGALYSQHCYVAGQGWLHVAAAATSKLLLHCYTISQHQLCGGSVVCDHLLGEYTWHA